MEGQHGIGGQGHGRLGLRFLKVHSPETDRMDGHRSEAKRLQTDGTAWLGQNGGPFHQVLEFAHVPRPGVGLQLGNCSLRESLVFEPVFAVEHFQKPGGEFGNILEPFPERRDVEGKHVQPVVQILPELPLGHGLDQIPVGACNHPHIHFDRLVAAHPLKLAFLKHPEQFALQSQSDLRNLVQQDRPSVRELKPAVPPLRGPGEGPFFVPKKLAFNQRLGNRRAVYPDERFFSAPTVPVNLIGHEFLAGPVFAVNEDGGIGAGDFLDEFAQPVHGGAVPDQFAFADGFLNEEIGHLHHALVFCGLFDHQLDLADGERFGHIIKSPGPHAVHHGLDRAVSGDHDHHRPVLSR